MSRVNRKEMYKYVSEKYGHGRVRMIALTDRIIDYCEDWAEDKNIAKMDPKEIHDILRKEIMQEERKCGAGGAFGFLPAFIWMFLLGQLISYIIKWWLENRT